MRTMIGAAEALELVLSRAIPREPSLLAASDAAGLVLARETVADRDFPPFDRATMDGFAVRLVHAGRTVAVRGEARPGIAPSSGPSDDACVEIMTGAPCPEGTEAVVMKEQVARDGPSATLPAQIALGQNIVRRAAECARGSVVLPASSLVTPIAIALLASVGQATVSARPLPSLAILTTGDELVQPGSRPAEAEIRDSNGPMLSAMAATLGIARPHVVHVRDTAEALASALDSVGSEDVVVLTGGVSAGNYDLVPAALASHGATLVFHKVRQQPGKPLLFAEKGSRLFFGLPGTPLGCHLGFERYVLPALRAMAGLAPRPPERGQLALAWSSPSDRQQFVLAAVTRRDGAWLVTPRVSRGSSDLFSVSSANAYMPVNEGTRSLPAGAEVTFQWLSGSA